MFQLVFDFWWAKAVLCRPQLHRSSESAAKERGEVTLAKSTPGVKALSDSLTGTGVRADEPGWSPVLELAGFGSSSG